MSKRIKLLGTELKIGILVIRWMALSSPSKGEFVPLLEEGDVGMVELLDLSGEGVEVLGLHVEDEDGDIEAVDLLELFFMIRSHL